MATPGDLRYDPTSEVVGRDPYPLYRRMRDDAPLYHDDEAGYYALSRYDDIERAHVDRETFISGMGVTLDMLRRTSTGSYQVPPGTVLMEDAPAHTVHRALLSRMFTPRRVHELEQEIRRLTCDLLDPLVDGRRFDFVADLGTVMPSMVIGMLIGVPEEERLAIREHYDPARRPDGADADALAGAIFAEHLDRRIQHPSDDILSVLAHTDFEDETGTVRRLTRGELLAFVTIIGAGGTDTTRRFIGWIGKVLSDHPGERHKLVEDPSLVPTAVDEIMRYETPALQTCRYTTRDVDVSGGTIPAGSIVAMLVGSANRDERRVQDPDRFDVTRKPGGMFTLGFGAHFCLGQALARLQGRVVIEEVLARFPRWEADTDDARFSYDGNLRGWDSFPVEAT